MKKQKLVNELKKEGFNEKIIKAFEKVRREYFVPEAYKSEAYENVPLPIGHEQTISQPYTIAFMLELLDIKNKEKILEVGSGSGYVLALIKEIAPYNEIYGIEIIKELQEKSKELLKNKKIKIFNCDGKKGLKEKSPFDKILVSAAANKIPEELIKQLKINGKLVMPLNNKIIQLEKKQNKNIIKEFYGFSFVPLV